MNDYEIQKIRDTAFCSGYNTAVSKYEKQNKELQKENAELKGQLEKLKPYRCKNQYQVSEKVTRNAVVCYRVYDCENCRQFKEIKENGKL